MQDSTRRTIRTTVQVLVGLAVALPELVKTAGLPDTLPGLGTALVVAGAVARLMASPVVDRLLPSWLKVAPERAELPPVVQ